MNENPFGPWATALSTPGEARLSTFWSRRMAMLPQLGRDVPASRAEAVAACSCWR